jgi:hypothetical protein
MIEVTNFPASLILIDAQYYCAFRAILSCRKHLGEKSRVLFLLWYCTGALEQVMDLEYKDQTIHGLNIVVFNGKYLHKNNNNNNNYCYYYYY